MNECEKLIQFNTNAISRDYATRFAALKFVNQDNYEEMKQKYGAEVPDYFSGSYDEFKTKRNQLTSLFVAAGYSSLQESYYQHSLSPEGAKAYAICMAEKSNKPIAAWIESITDDRIAIGVRCGLRAGAEVTLNIFGAQPINPPTPLGAGAVQFLLFEYNSKKDFIVIMNSVEGADGISIVLPKVRNFEIRKERKEISGTMTCGAGCHGNSSGCYQFTDVILAADPDFYLLPETLREINRRVLGGPGIRQVLFTWVEDKVGGQVRRLIGHPHSVDGQSGDTQGIIEIAWSVIAEKQYLVEMA